MTKTKHLQWQVEAIINATLARTWAAIEDLSLIPQYHPVVHSVEFPSGTSRRATGVEYKCIFPTGSRLGWCVEKVADHVPLRSTTAICTSDSRGLSKLIENFITEVLVEPSGGTMTRVISRGFYTPKGWVAAIVNGLVLRRTMPKNDHDALQGLKRFLESESWPRGIPAEPDAVPDTGRT